MWRVRCWMHRCCSCRTISRSNHRRIRNRWTGWWRCRMLSDIRGWWMVFVGFIMSRTTERWDDDDDEGEDRCPLTERVCRNVWVKQCVTDACFSHHWTSVTRADRYDWEIWSSLIDRCSVAQQSATEPVGFRAFSPVVPYHHSIDSYWILNRASTWLR